RMPPERDDPERVHCPRRHPGGGAAPRTHCRRAVFLDRDGVLIGDPGYLADPDGVRLLPDAAEAVRRLAGAGWRVGRVTNQSGVARGYFSEERLAAIHARLNQLLADEGAAVESIYYCPHLADGVAARYRYDCSCRKPAPGLLLAAAQDLDLDLARC